MPSPINAKFTISAPTGLARLDNLVFSSASSGNDISYLYDFGDNTTYTAMRKFKSPEILTYLSLIQFLNSLI